MSLFYTGRVPKEKHGLEDAKEHSERLPDRHVPVILK
jgi:hypothetical protein